MKPYANHSNASIVQCVFYGVWHGVWTILLPGVQE